MKHTTVIIIVLALIAVGAGGYWAGRSSVDRYEIQAGPGWAYWMDRVTGEVVYIARDKSLPVANIPPANTDGWDEFEVVE